MFIVEEFDGNQAFVTETTDLDYAVKVAKQSAINWRNEDASLNCEVKVYRVDRVVATVGFPTEPVVNLNSYPLDEG